MGRTKTIVRDSRIIKCLRIQARKSAIDGPRRSDSTYLPVAVDGTSALSIQYDVLASKQPCRRVFLVGDIEGVVSPVVHLDVRNVSEQYLGRPKRKVHTSGFRVRFPSKRTCTLLNPVVFNLVPMSRFSVSGMSTSTHP